MFFFWLKTVILEQEMHYYMVCIAYYTELDLQICNYAQKLRICREKSKYVLDESFCGHICPRRKAVNFCHPDSQTCKSESALHSVGIVSPKKPVKVSSANNFKSIRAPPVAHDPYFVGNSD